MSRPAGIRSSLRARTAVELAALAAGLAVFGYLGWDSALWDARLQLLLHLLVVAAALGLAMAAVRGMPLPRTRIDAPVLAVLAALALATASALNVGMSLRAMGSIAAFALALPLALLAVRWRPSWLGLVTAVPVLAFAIPTLAVLAWRRIEWVMAGAPGLPPLRLPNEGTPFGSVAVPPFVIWPAWALAGLIEPAAVRRPIRAGLVAVGVPLTVLSGSRSAWLALGVTALVAGVPWAWSRRRHLRIERRPSLRTGAVMAGGLLVTAAVVVLILPRFTAVTSLIYRVSLWRDTLTAWASDPLLGIGPGFMPYARQAAAADFTFPVRQPHSHNLPLGLLGDAGIVGLVAGIVVVVAVGWVAGPWRSRTPTGRAAALVLLGIGVGGLFEDLTFLPNFNLLAVALLAVALTDAGAVTWRPIPSLGQLRGRLAAGLAAVAGATLLVGMVVADAGAVTYRGGLDAAIEGDWSTASARFERSAAIDGWHPATPKALAVAADAAGDAGLARRAAETAVERNPGDGPSWANLALLCGELGDDGCQLHALERSMATAEFGGLGPINAALAYEALGREEEADAAYRHSLLIHRTTALATDWPRAVAIGDATTVEDLGALVEVNRLLAWWAVGEPIEPGAIEDPAGRALAHAMLDQRELADDWLERTIAARPDEAFTWDLAIVLREHWGRRTDHEREVARVVRGSPLAGRDQPARVAAVSYELDSFRGVPLDGMLIDAERLLTEPPYPWSLEAVLP